MGCKRLTNNEETAVRFGLIDTKHSSDVPTRERRRAKRVEKKLDDKYLFYSKTPTGCKR